MIILTKILQHFDCPGLSNVEDETRRAIGPLLSRHDLAGSSVAVALGSRGISCMPAVARATVASLRRAGARPFIVPAMGSHGGATARGQEEVLASYGITEETVGAPVRSCMETIQIGRDDLGSRVYMDRLAAEADHTIVANRVKPHTDFRAPVESGLMKMCVIGLGKHDGAREIHSFGLDGLRRRIVPSARLVLSTANVLGGVAIVENRCEEPRCIRVLASDEIESGEQELLSMARENMPSLPVDDLDILLIDRMGKDISGTGVDTSIIGRIRIAGQKEPETPRIKVIVGDSITPASHGNALGMGLLDIVTRRFRDGVDASATRENVLTSSFLERGKLPLVAPTYEAALQWALRCASVPPGQPPRVARIRDTLHLEELYLSEVLLPEIAGGADSGTIEVTARTLGATEEWR